MGRLISKTIKYEADNNKAKLAQKIQIFAIMNHIWSAKIFRKFLNVFNSKGYQVFTLVNDL